MQKEKRIIIEKLAKITRREIIDLKSLTKWKNLEAATKIRCEANELLKKEEHGSEVHEDIWQKFTMAIAVAPSGSEELAKSYASRACILFHLKKFRESVIDLERACEITNSSSLKTVCLCRKVQCYKALDDLARAQLAFHLAQFHLDRVEFQSYERPQVYEIVTLTEKLMDKKIAEQDEEVDKGVELKKKVNDFTDFSVKYDEKDKSHLVANRDVAPGEVIYVEKPYYTSILHLRKTFPYCSHCLSFCLTTVPCEVCSWFMFCSEQCRSNAFNEYHKFECIVFKDFLEKIGYEYVPQMALHLIITECEKSGSIKNFKQFLSSQKNGNWINNESLSKNQFEIIYSIFDKISPTLSKSYTDAACQILISLAINTTFFGKQYSVKKHQTFMNNEDILFIGSLLVKLLKYPHFIRLSRIPASLINFYGVDAFRGCCIAPVYSIINHSCDPNVTKYVSLDNTLVLYAIKPIKQNDQLFVSYSDSYRISSKESRKHDLNMMGITCKCTACTENWEPHFNIAYNLIKWFPRGYLSFLFSHDDLGTAIFVKCETEILNTVKFNRDLEFTEETIKKLSESIVGALKELSEPSILINLLITALIQIFTIVHTKTSLISNKCIRDK